MTRKHFWRFQIVRGGHRRNCHHVKISVASHSALLKYAYMCWLQVDLFTCVSEKTRNINECVLKAQPISTKLFFKASLNEEIKIKTLKRCDSNEHRLIVFYATLIYESACKRTAHLKVLRTPQRHSTESLRGYFDGRSLTR